MKLSELLRERARLHYVDLSDPILTSLCRLVDAAELWEAAGYDHVSKTEKGLLAAIDDLRKELEGEGDASP